MLVRRSHISADAVLFGLALALAAALPFEPIRPLVATPWLDLNYLKILLAAAAVVWLIGLRGHLSDLRALWPAALFVGLAALAAALAPSDRADALKFVGRLALGLTGLAIGTRVLSTHGQVRWLLWAIVLGAAVSGLLGLGEAAGWRLLDPLLAAFKVAPTHVGGDLRVSASFQYATIAAMFFELVTPLAIVLAATSRQRGPQILATAAGLLCSVMVVLTFTRAGLVALGVALAMLLAAAFARARWRALVVPTLITTACAAVAFAVLATRETAFATRLQTENDWGWYAATYAAPAELTLTPGSPSTAIVTAHNDGQAVWTSGGQHPFALAYRWLSADDTAQLEVPLATVGLPHDVAPGDSVELSVPVTPAVPPGDYRLAWGMLQKDVLWFHDRGYPDAESAVHVAPGLTTARAPTAIAQDPRTDTLSGTGPVARRDLWRAALGMFVQHPLLGIGPDNFRHTYGAYLGLGTWDARVHANNLYLELLADFGLLGTLAFALLVARPIRLLVRGARAGHDLVLVGLGASLAAFFVHGTLAYFLDFLSTAVLFWLIVGVSLRAPRLESC